MTRFDGESRKSSYEAAPAAGESTNLTIKLVDTDLNGNDRPAPALNLDLASPPPPVPAIPSASVDGSLPLAPEAQAIISTTVNVGAIVLTAISGLALGKRDFSVAFNTFTTARHKLAVPVEPLQQAAKLLDPDKLPAEFWAGMVAYFDQVAQLAGGSITAAQPTDMRQSLELISRAAVHGVRAVGEVDELGGATSLLATNAVRDFTKWLGNNLAQIVIDAPKDIDVYKYLIGLSSCLNAALGARFYPLAARNGQYDLSLYGTWVTSVASVFMGSIFECVERLRERLEPHRYQSFRVSTISSYTVTRRIEGLIKQLLPTAVDEYKWRMIDMQGQAAMIHDVVEIAHQRTSYAALAENCAQKLPKVPDRDWIPLPLQLKGTVTLVVLGEDGTGLVHQRGSVALHSSTAIVNPLDYSMPSGELDVSPGNEKSAVISVARMSGFGVSKDGTIISPMGLDIFSPPSLDDHVADRLRAIDDHLKKLVEDQAGLTPEVFELLDHADACVVIWGNDPIVCIPEVLLSPDEFAAEAEVVSAVDIAAMLKSVGITVPLNLVGVRFIAPEIEVSNVETSTGMTEVAEPPSIISMPLKKLPLTPEKELLALLWRKGRKLPWDLYESVLESDRIGCTRRRGRGSGDHSMYFRPSERGEESWTILPKWESGEVRILKRTIVETCDALGIPLTDFIAELRDQMLPKRRRMAA